MKKYIKNITLFVCCFGFFAAGTCSDIPKQGVGTLVTGVGFQYWKDPSVSQTALPFMLSIPVGEKFSLNIANTTAYSQWDDNLDENKRILGLSDTWIQGNYVFWRDRAMINAGISLPTGKTKLDTSQYILTREYLRRNFMRFRLPVYGQGMSLKIGGAVAYPVHERITIGLGAQFIHNRPFKPVYYEYAYPNIDGEQVDTVWERKYRPGDEISANLGVDILLSESMRLSIDGMYTYYGRDDLDESERFKSGDKLSLHIDYFYKFLINRYLHVSCSFRQKGRNEFLRGLVFMQETVNSNGPQVELDISSKLFAEGDNGIILLLSGRFNSKSDRRKETQELVGGAGIGIQYAFSENMMLDLYVKYYMSQLNTNDVIDNLGGLDTYVGIRYLF